MESPRAINLELVVTSWEKYLSSWEGIPWSTQCVPFSTHKQATHTFYSRGMSEKTVVLLPSSKSRMPRQVSGASSGSADDGADVFKVFSDEFVCFVSSSSSSNSSRVAATTARGMSTTYSHLGLQPSGDSNSRSCLVFRLRRNAMALSQWKVRT